MEKKRKNEKDRVKQGIRITDRKSAVWRAEELDREMKWEEGRAELFYGKTHNLCKT